MSKLHQMADGMYAFHCPGCGSSHQVTVEGTRNGSLAKWGWNGSIDKPTFSPSILIRSGHYADGLSGQCWCTYNAARPNEPASFVCSVCHSFVADGRIQFLGDCTHALAGQTVEIPEWE
jgi:hypothetical protein